MGGTARQFNNMYLKYKQRFKKPIANIAILVSNGFSDDDFVNQFKELYPHIWEDLNKQYKYWHDKNEFIIDKEKKSRYNFRKPYNFILDCSYHVRIKLRKSKDHQKLSQDEKKKFIQEILSQSAQKLKNTEDKQSKNLYYIQEIYPLYVNKYISKYFREHDLHVKLEIVRELSKYKSNEIVQFFYKVNSCTRNFSLKQESMRYIQRLGLPFVLRRKKEGKTNYIDNEVVKNNSSPEELLQRLYVDNLEKLKAFDVFISHNSRDESEISDMFKLLNAKGYVAYIDWVNDKFDLKREWCNATTSLIIRERIHQSRFVVLFFSDNVLNSQWCSWELGYADALGKKICIFNLMESSTTPQFYYSYPKLLLEDSQFYIYDGDKKTSLEEWL